ncbi:MAG: TetR family transcriptional regulator [Deltaproteobacteria bacterium]|nr:TetR family transcriptional regulator [Deltaproteobacteria bacterium]
MLRTDPAQIAGLRDRNKADKLARIEKAGRALFARRGFDATTTRAIAEKAGIGIGTLFLYFPEKKDLLIHLFHRDIAAVEADIFATLPAKAPLGAQLEHVFFKLYDYYARDLALARVFLPELMFLDAERRGRVTAFTADFLKRIAELIAAAQRRGELRRGVDAGQTAYAAFALYCFTLINWVGGILPSLDAARAQLAASLAVLLTGLTTARKA